MASRPPASHSDSEADGRASAHATRASTSQRRRRLSAPAEGAFATPSVGRRRKLPEMTSGQRARYYRLLHAAEHEALQQTTVLLRRQVDRLECHLGLSRQLAAREVSAPASRRLIEFVREFVERGIHARRLGLQNPVYEIESVRLQGDAIAPVVRVDAVASGRLTTDVVNSIYPCVIGNSTILDALIHEPMRYTCAFIFFFSKDGVVERESIEVSTITGLRTPLGALRTVAQVVAQVNVLPGLIQDL